MTSSTRCSSRRRGASAALAMAALAACSHARTVQELPPLRIAIFPVQNAAGGYAPIRQLSEMLEGEVIAAESAAIALPPDAPPDAVPKPPALEVVPHKELESVLASHRFRYTGGLDSKTARALRDELGVQAVLIPVLEQWSNEKPPKVALSARLVFADERPSVFWADFVARAGDDSPGLLGLGLVPRMADLEQIVVQGLAARVERYVRLHDGGDSCGGAGRFSSRRVFRSPVLDDVGRRSIAVLPFIIETGRRGAAEIVLGQVLTQLVRTGRFEVLDPGFVREQLLSHRVLLQGGVSVDNAMAMLELLDTDLVMSGYIEDFDAPNAGSAPPRAAFTTYVLDRDFAELVWSSTSQGGGDDGVFFFDAGRVSMASTLTCRLARGVADGLKGNGTPIARSDGASGRKQCVQGYGCAGQAPHRISNRPDSTPFSELGRARDVKGPGPVSKLSPNTEGSSQ